ncbi:MAG: alpha/beta hydrolase [Pseudomonadota bacterium]
MRLLAVFLAGLVLVGASAAADQVGAARAYLERLEKLPEDFAFGRFEPTPGIVLETGRLAARGPSRGTVVFVPGYTAPLELYAQEMRALAEAGWDVAALVLRGQGRSVRLATRYDLGHVRDYANLTADLAAFVARQEGPIVVVGLSQGAHVALRMAADYAPEVLAYALIVPMIGIPGGRVGRGVADLLARNGAAGAYLPGSLPWPRRTPFTRLVGRGNVCQPDADLANLRRALMEVDPDLRVEVPSAGWVSATFASIDVLERIGPSVEAPVLMVTAGRDRVVSSRAAGRLCARMSDCREVRLPGAPHCAVEGDARRSPVVMEAVTGFLARESAAR